jgi:hypothetical protein
MNAAINMNHKQNRNKSGIMAEMGKGKKKKQEQA